MPAIAEIHSPVARGRWTLRESDADGEVLVCNADGDRWVVTTDKAVRQLSEAAEREARAKALTGQVVRLMAELQDWTDANAADIDHVILSLRPPPDVTFVVVRKTVPWNDELETALTDLDLKVAGDEDYGLLRLDVIALPKAPPESVIPFARGGRLLVYRPGGGDAR